MRLNGIVLFMALIAGGSAIANSPPTPAPVPLKDFARRAEFQKVTISPSGEFLAALTPYGDQIALAFLRTSDLTPVSSFRLVEGESVADFWWVSDRRVMLTVSISEGPLDPPALTGELVGLDVDAKRKTYLYGWRGFSNSGGRLKNKAAELGYAQLIDPLVGDPEHALIQTQQFMAGGEDFTKAYKLDVMTAARQLIGVAPIAGYSDLIADPQHRVRYAVVQDRKNRMRTFWKPTVEGNWEEEYPGNADRARIIPLRFDASGTKVFLKSTESGERYCLVQRTLGESAGRQSLACDDASDLGGVVWDPISMEPIAALFNAGKPRAQLLGGKSPLAERYGPLLETFGARGEFVIPSSITRDGGQAILFAYSDRNPGDYYLFDVRTGKARYLLSQREWIDPAIMAERRAVTYAARDGTLIHAFLTLPRGVDPKNLPLVTMPHGGPKGIRDDWAWDAEAQALAAHGFAVLQPNFRGSAGYGVKFEEDSQYRWGSLLIDDITDGTHWAIEQGYADPARLCIVGGSYGGYAALTSVVREPDLYRCAVGFAGVYDIEEWRDDFDGRRNDRALRYVDDWVFNDKSVARKQSPLHQVDRIKAALFLVHGDSDERVPISQFRALRSALKARDYPFEEMVKSGEGHGFYKIENQTEYLERMIAFVKRHTPSLPQATPVAAQP